MQAACETAQGRFAYLAPLYTQVKKTAWDALKLATLAPGVRVNEAELRVDFPNGARIQLFGADNYDALRGMHLDGIVLDEYAQMHPQAWDAVIRPALSIREGFAIFIGTPRGRNQFHDLYLRAQQDPEWFTALYRWSDSGVFEDRPEEITSARTSMSPEMFAQEYECSFDAAIPGAYYAQQLEAARAGQRIRAVPWEANVVVDTWWDLGWDDATAIIFTQTVGREIHLIDYLEARHEPLAFYAKELQRRAYLYGTHYLPHDADKTELGSGHSLREQLADLRLINTWVVRRTEVEEGIQAARALFSRCWFDEVKCARLIDCLASYRQEWIDRTQSFGLRPRHDEYSHGADAFRYMAIGFDQTPPGAPPPQRYAKTMASPMLRPGETLAQPRRARTTFLNYR